MTRLRAGSRVRFAGPVVLKFDPVPTPVERRLHRRWGTFAPSVAFGCTRVLARGVPATIEDLPAGRALLARSVWSRPGPAKIGWRQLLVEHLRRVYPSAELIRRVNGLQAVLHHTLIHGDATVANLVVVPGLGVRWIDPLDRPYVPGSWLVDVGKMLQSCWGYEAVLAGAVPSWYTWAGFLVTNGMAPANAHDAETWMLVHLARLLRYHDARVAGDFRWVLRDRYGCT